MSGERVIHEWRDETERAYCLEDGGTVLVAVPGENYWMPEHLEPVGYAVALELARVITADRWIPVSERLPEEDETVLGAESNGQIGMGSLCDWGLGDGPCVYDVEHGNKFTHWRPLPAPPTD